MTTRVRLQLDFTAAAAARLDQLVETTEASSRAEVMRWALFLAEEAVNAQASGGSLVVRDAEGREREIRLPFRATA